MVRIAYLTLYNLFGLAGWGFILFTVVSMAGQGRLKNLWDEHEWTVKVVQGAAVLEIAHAGLGLVRSPMSRTFIQVSRGVPRRAVPCRAAPRPGCRAAPVPARAPPPSRVSFHTRSRAPGVFARRDRLGRAGPAVQVPVHALPQAQGLRAHARDRARVHRGAQPTGDVARAHPGRALGDDCLRTDIARRANLRADGLLPAAAGHRRNAGDVEHC